MEKCCQVYVESLSHVLPTLPTVEMAIAIHTTMFWKMIICIFPHRRDL